MENFFIVGAQKAGTTALHAYLSQHSQLLLSSQKELHFFDDETMDWTQPHYEKLVAGMSQCVGQISGEATPIYMYWPNSIERIHAYDPSVKIIILLRHPVFRAYSHWCMETLAKKETLSFSDAIRNGRSRVSNEANGAHRVFSYVERGFYSDQIKHIIEYFPRSQVHFALTDQLWLHPKSTLCAIEQFLGIDTELNPTSRYIITTNTNISDTLTNVDFSFLMDTYKADIRSTAEITGLSLGNWLHDDYQEPKKV